MTADMIKRAGRAPAGYRMFIPPFRPLLLHLSIDGQRTLCERNIRADWLEPQYTQRSKCRRCYLRRAELREQAEQENSK